MGPADVQIYLDALHHFPRYLPVVLFPGAPFLQHGNTGLDLYYFPAPVLLRLVAVA